MSAEKEILFLCTILGLYCFVSLPLMLKYIVLKYHMLIRKTEAVHVHAKC